MPPGDTLNPIGLLLILVMGALTFVLPRHQAFIPLLVTAVFMPLGQMLVVAGINLHLFRLLLLIGIIRVAARGELTVLRLNTLDKTFIAWVIVSVVFGTLVAPSSDLFISRMGDAYNAAMTYFFLRCLIQEWDDLLLAMRTLAICVIPLACLLLFENRTGRNLLSIFGGVPELTVIRNDRLRCQGAFRHPILTGTFGASVFPLAVALWNYSRRWRGLATAGAICSVAIVYFSSSSGPLLALAAAIGGLFMWRFRDKMRLLRWGIVAGIIFLELAMQAPFYYIIERVSQVVGGTGWHRSYLIDVAIRNIDEWWLFGTTYTAHWGPGGQVIAADPNHMDITNHYIMEGVKGGLLKLMLFVSLIVICFSFVGRALENQPEQGNRGFVIWALGVCVLTHCVSFISVPYFDQIVVFWYWIIASIAFLGMRKIGGLQDFPNHGSEPVTASVSR